MTQNDITLISKAINALPFGEVVVLFNKLNTQVIEQDKIIQNEQDKIIQNEQE